MSDPTWDIAYTTDDASDSTPTWTNVSVANIRQVTINRGRDDELGRVDAGTAQIVLNNRTRLFDPQIVTGLRPMNRWRIRATWSAVTYDLFLGYAESYDQQWPATGKDSICTVRLVDEFKVLAMDRLPAMDPQTAQTYADVVMSDEPQGYWEFHYTAPNAFGLEAPTAGGTYMGIAGGGGTLNFVTSPIIGDPSRNVGDTDLIARSTTTYMATKDGQTTTDGLEPGGPGDAGGLTAFTFETWIKSSEATPASARNLVIGPNSGATPQWGISLGTSGLIDVFARNGVGTFVNPAGTTHIAANTWYHVAILCNGTNIFLFVNGVAEAVAAFSGAFGTMDAGGFLQLGTTTAVGGTRYYDRPAFYRYALDGARILAHYTAGAVNGYPSDAPEDRATDVMADSTSIAATDFNSTIGREMIPAFKHGQSPLEELRVAESAESGSAFLFVTSNGTVRMLQDGYEGIAPYNSVSATFDDDGTDLPYIEATFDYSETFLANSIEMSRLGGAVVVDDDATSIARYLKRTMTLPALPILSDGDVTAIAASLLARYKDPIERITTITVYLKTSALIVACLGRDLGDLIRVLRTPVGGGARKDEQLHIQSIQLTAQPGHPWVMRFGVSP